MHAQVVLAASLLLLASAHSSDAKHAEWCECTDTVPACLRSLPADAADLFAGDFDPLPRESCEAQCTNAWAGRPGAASIATAHAAKGRCDATFSGRLARCLIAEVRNGTNGCRSPTDSYGPPVELGLDPIRSHLSGLYLRSGVNRCIVDCYGREMCTAFSPFHYGAETAKGPFVQQCGCIAEMSLERCTAQIVEEDGNICECVAKEVDGLDCTVDEDAERRNAAAEAAKCSCADRAQSQCVREHLVAHFHSDERPADMHPCEAKCAGLVDAYAVGQVRKLNATLLMCRNELDRKAAFCVNERIRSGVYGCEPAPPQSTDAPPQSDSGDKDEPLWRLYDEIMSQGPFADCMNACYAEDTAYWPKPMRSHSTVGNGLTAAFRQQCGCYSEIPPDAVRDCKQALRPGFMCNCVAKLFPQLKCDA